VCLDQHPQEWGRRAWAEEELCWDVVTTGYLLWSHGAFELGWPFRDGLTRAEGAGPLYLHQASHWIWSTPEERVWTWMKQFLEIHLRAVSSPYPSSWRKVNPSVLKEENVTAFVLLSQYIFISWVAYKKQTFISQNSGGWEVQDQGTGRFDVCWGLIFWFIRWPSSCGVVTWQKR
jgi:hypothetical protein